ncbi:phosphoadenylyl-sulfate reductase [Actinomyces slackii]|uniref:Adenosine 5'-phosphosulfate reductase n=1 Tax=Actinomyces slackii TaxID=52774 RepID=A0A448KFE1_9ACTO|nr:phosphoadenylyl-sulfate reductase [Actinomyces slackii]VEG75656.1 Phosphoadenosine phosphosulfate reductase [Actinomyces slackii]
MTTHLPASAPAPPAAGALRSREELKELALAGARELGESAPALDVAQWAAQSFPGTLAVACSMADAVLPHLIARVAPGVDVLFLDTGYHFPETMGTRDAVAATMDVRVVDIHPELSVAEQDARHGVDLWSRDPAACCRMRKVEPLARALEGYEAWATGVRREEAPTRTGTPLVGWDETHGIVKINPLAAWSFEELTDYAQQHGVVINPLLYDGYPSIGCAPCTRRVAPGDDPRSGRWAGFTKTECGIHL